MKLTKELKERIEAEIVLAFRRGMETQQAMMREARDAGSQKRRNPYPNPKSVVSRIARSLKPVLAEAMDRFERDLEAALDKETERFEAELSAIRRREREVEAALEAALENKEAQVAELLNALNLRRMADRYEHGSQKGDEKLCNEIERICRSLGYRGLESGDGVFAWEFIDRLCDAAIAKVKGGAR